MPPDQLPPPVTINLTLQQQSDYLDEHFDLGDGLSLRDTVYGLARARWQAKECDRMRDEYRDVQELHYRVGNITVPDGRVLVYNPGTPAHRERVLNSKRLEKLNNRAFKAARTIQPRVQVTSPLGFSSETVRLPTLLINASPGQMARRIDMVLDLRRSANAEIEKHKARIEQIVEATDWAGQKVTFKDLWSVQARVQWFDAEVFRQQRPDLWDRFQMDKDYPATAGRYRLIKPGQDFEGDPYVD